MKPGRYEKLPFDEYINAPGLNTSTLKTFAESPALVQWEKDCPEDEDKKQALDIGNALHCLVLEPTEFINRYAVEPSIDRRTNAGKAKAVEFEETNKDKIILTAKEFKVLNLMRGSVWAYPDAMRLLENQTGTEISIFAEDEYGQLIKIRIDLESKINGATFIVDLKSIDKISNISQAINERDYDLQYAVYREAYKIHHGFYPDFFLFIFVAKTIECGRYPTRVGELCQADKDSGYEKYHSLKAKYRECMESGIWPGIETFSRWQWAK